MHYMSLIVTDLTGDWTISMAEALHTEWQTRFGHETTKVHKSFAVVQYLKANPPKTFETDLTAMYIYFVLKCFQRRKLYLVNNGD